MYGCFSLAIIVHVVLKQEEMYIPNSIKVALAIGHWQLGVGHVGIRTQCNALLE